jgi:DNA-binding transcriptional LysR family regulator
LWTSGNLQPTGRLNNVPIGAALSPTVELRHLRYFVVLAEELHFGRAADRLHIVQPGLSKQIAALESEIGVQLFDRTRRHVALTDAGEVLYREASAILHRVARAVEAAQQTARGEIGGLEIGYTEPAMWAVLPAALTAHRGRYPGVRFRLWQDSSAALALHLLDQSLDVAFVRMPVHEHDLVFEPVTRERFVVTLPEGHRLASAEAVDLTELADEGFVMTPRSAEPGYFDRAIALCRAHGFAPRIVEEGNGPGSVLGMVAGGLGVALSPESIGTVPWRGVTFRPLVGPHAELELELALAYRRDDATPALRAFTETVAAVTAVR